MPQPSDTPTIESELPAHASQRDIQRVALRELVRLLTESATTESEIEARHRTAKKELEKSTGRSRQEIEHRYASARVEAETTHRQAIEEIDARYVTGVRSLDASIQTTRMRINQDHEGVIAGVKQRFEQASFMAESLLEATQNTIRDEWKKSKREHEEQMLALDEKETKGIALVQTYGQPLPEIRPELGVIEGDPADAFRDHRTDAERHLSVLKTLQIPRLFVGVRPWLAGTILLALGGFIGHAISPGPSGIMLGALGASVLAIILGIILRIVGGRQVIAEFNRLLQSLDTAREASELELKRLRKLHEARNVEAQRQRDDEVRKAKAKFAPYVQQADETRDENLQNVQIEYKQKLGGLEVQRDRERNSADDTKRQSLAGAQTREQHDLQAARQKLEQQARESEQWYGDSRQAVERRWRERLAQIQTPISRADETAQPADWNDPHWQNWSPPKKFGSSVRFGELSVDLEKIADEHPQGSSFQLELPPPFKLPAALTVPRQASLLIQTDRTGRQEAMGTIQTVMLRLLTALPPGRVRFTIIDPVGLGQNFAGFMHLADHDEALIGGRIWTDSEHIDIRLRDLTEHMETVIQKYLRNEFATIDDYNEQAGELAEPYRFLVISDFPVGFEGDTFRRLQSILQSGPRCGVYTLIHRDSRLHLPAGVHLDELEHHGANLVRDTEENRFVWKDDVFKQFPLTLDPPPSEELLTKIVHVVGKHAKDSKRVEVPFETIAPTDEKFWTGSSADDLRVSIGKMGATRLQQLRLGRGVAQHVLIAGKTGSGKSTLLHALVTNLAMWYSPEEVEFYLIDFKKGVEFKTYATHSLPHARAIAVESDREFGLSVLQRLDGELSRRGDIFRKAAVQDIGAYRKVAGAQVMPRTLLVIDEFQEFFSEDDKLAQEAGLLLDRLVRQGRAFGIHLLLGSQTIGGTSGLARSTIGQMAVRIALQTSEADSHLILGDNNSAARLLTRPGEAIYNDAGGLVEANSPFQVAWLPDARREVFLAKVSKRASGSSITYGEPPVVFEGNAPADLAKNAPLNRLLNVSNWPQRSGPALGYIGDPVAIKDPTAISFRRQSGANLLVIGQQEDAGLATLVSVILSIAAQRSPAGAQFTILDGTPAGSPLAGQLQQLKEILPHEVNIPEFRVAGDAVGDYATEVQKRLGGEVAPDAPDLFLIVYGLQRYRALRKSEDDFSFSMSTSDEPKKPNPGKQFADLLKDGPSVGVFVLAWIDTATAIDRTLDRASLREFDNRVLFQMSANDSSTLIDSPTANKLGFYRALSFSEEQGTMEKYRPYALPEKQWLGYVAEQFKRRTAEHAHAGNGAFAPSK